MRTIECVEDAISYECVMDICQSGNNDNAVNEWINKLNITMSSENCIKIIKEWAIDDYDESDLHQLRSIVLWLAAWNVFESEDYQGAIDKRLEAVKENSEWLEEILQKPSMTLEQIKGLCS